VTMKKRGAFTLIELPVVIAVIGSANPHFAEIPQGLDGSVPM
jgi:prepilin-type N-terminal cleavage/methylation domain-containing protein